mmetsp:Transcript_8550/g.14732  ORF Transcript_8550/g.14732 Transcript_8550/m.14732 type:complete len:568 (+) Transcript_8550:1011-2714(+)
MLVVDDHHLHRDVLGGEGGEFLNVHEEGAVAVNVNHQRIRAGHLCTDGRREAETHRAEPTGGDPVARLREGVPLRREHLMLPDACGDDRLASRQLVQDLDRMLRLDELAVNRRIRHGELLAHSVQLRLPRAEVELLVLILDHVAQAAQGRLAVRTHGHVRRLVLVNFRGVDVDVHDARPGGELLQLAGHAVVETHTHRQQQVGMVNGVVGHHGAVHAKHVHGLRVVLSHRECAQPLERLSHRNPGCLHKLAQLLGRIQATTADVQHRLLRCGQRLDDLLQHQVGRARRRQAAEVASELQLLVPVGDRQHLLDVLGDVHEHGPGPPGVREQERLAHHAGEIVDVGHEVVVLRDLAGDLHDGSLLEPVGADHGAGHLPGDGHHGHAVQHGIGQTGDKVGRAGAGGRDAHRSPAGRHAVALRSEDLALLVTAEDVADGLGARERLVDLHACATGVGKHQIYPLPLQSLHQHVSPLAFLVVSKPRLESALGRVVHLHFNSLDGRSRRAGNHLRTIRALGLGARHKSGFLSGAASGGGGEHLPALFHCTLPGEHGRRARQRLRCNHRSHFLL